MLAVAASDKSLSVHSRIVYANNYTVLRGGAERVMFDEYEHFRSAGCDVNIFGGYEPSTLPTANVDLLPSVLHVDKLTTVGRLAAAVRIVYNRGTGRLFGRFLDRVRPHLVHGHNIYGGLTTSIIDACRHRGIPFVQTLHDYKLVCPSYRMLSSGKLCQRCVGGNFYHCLWSKCHKSSFQASLVSTTEAYFNEWFGQYASATTLISPSRFLARQVIAHGFPDRKLRIIPNGVDPNRFQPNHEDSGYILYVGRLSPEKGVGTLVRAAVDCRMRLRIAGEGPERAALESLAASLDASVSFEGRRTEGALRSLFRDAAFVVVPSEWFENASMTILEAMAYGKPLIAARIGGIPEQVEDSETGFLFESGNVYDLARVMRTLMSDPGRRQRMGRAARHRLERDYSLQKHCELLRGAYEQAIRT